MRFILLFVFVTHYSLVCTAQKVKTEKDLPLLKPLWFSLSSGINALRGLQADSGVFHSLARTDNSHLHPDLNGYFRSDGFSVDGGGEFALSAAFLIRKQDKQAYRNRTMIRAGLIYCGNTFLSDSYSKTRAVRFDTLTGQTQTLYLDSVYRYYHSFSYHINQVGIDVSVLFSTNPEKLIGLYGGLSLAQYLSVKNTVNVSSTESFTITETDVSGVQSNNNAAFGEDGNFKRNYTQLNAKSCFTTRIAVPVGATCKLAKTKKFWKSIQLFLESKPGLDITIVSGFRNYVRPKLSLSGGFRLLLPQNT